MRLILAIFLALNIFLQTQSQSLVPLNFKDAVQNIHEHKKYHLFLKSKHQGSFLDAAQFDLNSFLQESFLNLNSEIEAFNLSLECSIQLDQLAEGLKEKKDWSIRGNFVKV